jgi:DNA repair exonuclease SbcCD ATPase subunit
MITAVYLDNFQSYKDTEIKFSEGLNSIAGSSNSGKTAILRAINWVVYNRPSGIDIIANHSIVNDKGALTADVRVDLFTEKGRVVRLRGKVKNQYEVWINKLDGTIDTQVFDAVKTDVPQQVIDFLGIRETSIQKQHDAPFLLSDSPSDVAKFFNKIVHLDKIDVLLGDVELTRRRSNQEVTKVQADIDKVSKDIENYNFIDTAQIFLSKLKGVEEHIKEKKAQSTSLQDSVEDYNRIYDTITELRVVERAKVIIDDLALIKHTLQNNEAPQFQVSIDEYIRQNEIRENCSVSEAKPIAAELDSVMQKIRDVSASKRSLAESITAWSNIDNKQQDFSEANDLIARIGRVKERYHNTYQALRQLSNLCESYESHCDSILEARNEIIDLKKRLPDICPTCGQPLKETA